MLTIKATGSIADVIRDVQGVPARVIPYAASTALTRVAQIAAKTELPAEMRRVFDGPVAYTLNSLFVQPSNKDTLSARVMVKTSAAGIAPERFLQPEVEGGSRGEKRFERALRYAGLLPAGMRAMPGEGLPRDASGNVSGARVRSILAGLKVRDGKGRAGLFAGVIRGTRGVWQRTGRGKSRGVKPLFIFTSTAPRYRQRLDFTGVAQRTAQANFKPEFDKALSALLSRSR